MKKEGEEVLQVQKSEDHGETAVPLQPIEVHDGADTHLQPMEDSTLEHARRRL